MLNGVPNPGHLSGKSRDSDNSTDYIDVSPDEVFRRLHRMSDSVLDCIPYGSRERLEALELCFCAIHKARNGRFDASPCLFRTRLDFVPVPVKLYSVGNNHADSKPGGYHRDRDCAQYRSKCASSHYDSAEGCNERTGYSKERRYTHSNLRQNRMRFEESHEAFDFWEKVGAYPLSNRADCRHERCPKLLADVPECVLRLLKLPGVRLRELFVHVSHVVVDDFGERCRSFLFISVLQ